MYNEIKIFGILSECIAAIFAAIYFYKYKNTRLKPLFFLLWYILINEILCQYIFAKTSTGFLLYNLYDLIAPLSVVYLIKTQVSTKIRSRLILILLFTILFIFIGSLFLFNPLKEFYTFNFMVFTILVVIALMIYFVELLQSNEVLHIAKNLFLWVSLGFLIFFLAYPVISLARKLINEENNQAFKALDYILFTVGIISYLTIAFGFYYGDKKVDSNIEIINNN